MCILLSMIVIMTAIIPASADSQQVSVNNTQSQEKISREVLDKVRGNTPAMSESESQRAIDLITEKNQLEQQAMHFQMGTMKPENLAAQNRLNYINAELSTMNVVPLDIEDLYTLSGREYRPGADGVPDDTNYVKFYGLTTYIDDMNYEVWSIVAYSAGFPNTSILTPLYKEDTITIFNEKTYVSGDLSKVLDSAASAAGWLKKPKAETLATILSRVAGLATYLNPTSEKKLDIKYTCGQTFIYSYVAESSVGYFTFMLAGERKSCSIILIPYLMDSGTPQILPSVVVGDFDFRAQHYADYDYAVERYKNGLFKTTSYVGSIIIKLDEEQIGKINMPTYAELWAIPGI